MSGVPPFELRRLSSALGAEVIGVDFSAPPEALPVAALYRALLDPADTAAFDEIAADFERSRSGVRVRLSTASSDVLAVQIRSEGVADVFVSASEPWMDVVAEDPGVRRRVDLATNHLVLVTPPDNPAGIASIADLARPGVQLVLAAEGVPVGDLAREALANAGVAAEALANVVSDEEDDAAVVARITSGEADAAIVYASDVSAAAGNELLAIALPDDVDVTTTYPIAVVEGAHDPELAEDFVSFVTGAQGQAVLEDYGFEPIE